MPCFSGMCAYWQNAFSTKTATKFGNRQDTYSAILKMQHTA
jgi:hypothetical protein